MLALCLPFEGSANTLYDVIMIDICHYTVVQSIGCITSRVNDGLWVIMIKCRFILGKKKKKKGKVLFWW